MFSQVDNSNSLSNCLSYVESFTIYKNGKEQNIDRSHNNFQYILENLENLFTDARIMPAFGVSLHNEILEAIKTDTWLEINFSSEQNVNNLPFASILFKFEETYGINLIRKYNNKYEGRCIYLDFLKKVDLKDLISQNKNEI